MNVSGITKVSATNVKQILINPTLQMSVSVLVANTGVVAGSDGKKIIKAGTPLEGSLETRESALKVTAVAANTTAILLHDVDVTAGNANATALIFGFVNLNRIDTTTAALLTADVKAALKGKVTFLKG